MKIPVEKSITEKLLELCSSSEPSIKKSFAKEIFGENCQALIDENILLHFKNLKDVEVCDGDHEYVSEIQRRDGKNMYFSPADGWVAVNEDEIALYKVNLNWFVRQIMIALDIDERHTPKNIFEENIWALGQHRIDKQNINLIVARNLKSSLVLGALVNYLNDFHKARNPALVIALDKSIPSHLVLPGQNKLIKIDEAIKWDKKAFELNTVLLTGKMGGIVSQPGFSVGYRTLLSNGKTFKFTKKQAEALEYIDKQNGKPVNQDEVLAGINSTQSKLLQLFRSNGKKHQAWNVIIKGDGNGSYWLEY